MLKSIRVLLAGLVDYAGLFPPAGLAMAPAVQNYAAYRAGPTAWALGRFILPVTRLAEFEDTVAPYGASAAAEPWRLSVLGSGDLSADLHQIRAFNQRHSANVTTSVVVIDTIELKATEAQAITEALRLLDGQVQPYFEVPIHVDPRDLITALHGTSGRAKVRTGGTSADLFPTTEDLVRFIVACGAAQVPFKATAGLHHPLRSVQRLTYAPDSPTGSMYGFLNVFLTAALLHAGLPPNEAPQVLEEPHWDAFTFTDDHVTWRDHQLDVATLLHVRQHVAQSFGSCSFDEPINDLKAVNML